MDYILVTHPSVQYLQIFLMLHLHFIVVTLPFLLVALNHLLMGNHAPWHVSILMCFKCLMFCLLSSKKCEAKRKRNWLKGRHRKPIFYTSVAVVLIRNMLTHRLARILIFSPSTFPNKSLSSVARSLSPSLLFPPPSPSFWQVGSSEVVAVCIAKGNVSSTHRKMGQNIMTLPAHAHWLTQCWGYNHGVNQITVSSHIICHAWMFPLLTPVFSHQLLTAHNSSRLSSPLLQSVWSNAVVWTWRR